MWKTIQISLFSLIALSLISCETGTYPRGKRTVRILETKILKGAPKAAAERRFVQEGIASWYGPNFHKKRTANGEVYDMYGMTAAHKTIPFHIYIKATNLENGKSVVVRINDRGPYAKDRILDLTYTAAYKLGMLENGTTPVKIEGLGFIKEVEGKRVYISPVSYQIEGTLTLQVSSFANKENAYSLAQQLKGNFPDIHVTELDVEGNKYYRVLVGKYKTSEEAEEDMARLIKAGFKGTHLLTE